jgi:hypothetical protein
MQIPAGPNQIAQTYMGNPSALQNNIQKEQQQKAAIMPDFAKLLALGTVTSQKDEAQKAMALQQLAQLQAQSPTGKPPTIFEQIQQKAAQMAAMRNQQAQPQQPQGLPGLASDETVQAAQGGHIRRGIDHLPTNFKFGGGGIVAFQKGGEPPEEPAPSTNLDEVIARATQQLSAAEKSGDQKAIDFYTQKIQNLQTYKPKLREAPEKPSLLAAGKAPPLGAYKTITSNAPISGQDLGIMFKDMQSQGLDNVTFTKRPDENLGEATAAGTPSAPSYVAPASLPDEKPHPLEADVQKYVKESLAKDPIAEGQAAIKRQQELVGLEALLAPREKRIADIEALQRRQQANREHGWIPIARTMALADPRKGLGFALAKGAEGYEKAQAAYDEEDLKFKNDIMKLEDEVLKARIEGRYKDAATGEAAIKQILSEKQHAGQAGASLINTTELARARKQAAADALAGRLQTAQIQAEARRDAARIQAEQKRLEREKQQQQFQERMAFQAEKFTKEMDARWGTILNTNEEYKKISGELSVAQMRLARAKTPEAQEKLLKEIHNINTRKLEIQQRILGGRGNVGEPSTEGAAGAKKTIKFNEIK